MSRLLTSTSVLQALSQHIGRNQGITAAQLVCEILCLPVSDPVEERRLRRIVEDLRREGHHVCAHPTDGYFIAATASELDDTCAFLYERAMTSLKQIAAMKRISLPDLRGQLHLPT
jgi:hypothetical protein